MKDVSEGQPVPQGAYVAARRHGGLIFTSGMTPRDKGILMAEGPVRAHMPLETYEAALVMAAGNALRAAQSLLQDGESITAILSMTVFIAAEPDFTSHSKLADFASHWLAERLGPESIGTRAAVGVATLPGNAPVEIQLVAAV